MVSIEKARDFVHANGTMWERALWDHLFDDGSLDRVHQTLLCYKNPDGGWGHGLEHDIKCPSSTPLALEFLLTVMRDTGIAPGTILDKTSQWVEQNANSDGCLQDSPDLKKYPLADWHPDGHGCPLSIAGNLNKFGLATEKILSSAHVWALSQPQLTLDGIRKNDWLFMAYTAFDYFMNTDDADDIEDLRKATIANIDTCALGHEKKGEFNKLFPLFQFVNGPESDLIQGMSEGLIGRILDYLEKSQRDDGGWEDEHGLKYWQPYFSTVILLALKRFGRI